MMSESSQYKRKITLSVYNKDFPVEIVPEEEVYYRQAARLINDTIGFYTNKYQDAIGKEDLLYMALIDVALRYERESGRYDQGELTKTLAKLTSDIEAALKEK
ncbi:MAG: cell division protein ZapA [Prevotella sp.]